VDRRQYERKALEGEDTFGVSLFLSAQSLVHEGRNERFELAAKALDISAGGLKLRLTFKADLLTLRRGQELMVRMTGKQKLSIPAHVAHYEHEKGTLGISFDEPLGAVNS